MKVKGEMSKGIKLGISACLLGEKVRYDGGHKLDPFLTGTFGKYIEYIPVCPESECGFGIPREPLRLMGNSDAPRLVTTHTKIDVTDRMIEWTRKRISTLRGENISGFVFKSKSPSCGLQGVKVYDEEGGYVKKGTGLFAKALMWDLPLLPVEDEERLHDPLLCEIFLELCLKNHG